MSKKRVSGAWVDDTPHIYNTSTDTFSTLPHEVIGDGTAISSYTIKGNMQQSGTPTPSNPVYPQETGDKTANLFDKNNADIYDHSTLGNTDEWSYTPTSTGVTIRIPVKSNTQYTFKIAQSVSTTVFRISYVNSENVPITVGTGAIQVSTVINDGSLRVATFTTLSDTKYIVFQPQASALQSVLDTLMFNEGQPMDYEPFGYKIPILSNGNTYPVYLAEPIRKISTYADECPSTGTASRPIKKLVLTGEETVTTVTGNAPYKIEFDDIIQQTNINIVLFYCSHYIAVSNSASWAQYNSCVSWLFSNGMNVKALNFRDTTKTNANDFKQYLADQYAAGTPVTVWYVLATPKTESFTAPTLPTSGSQQTFDVDTTLAPSEVSLTYHGWHDHTDTKYSNP